VVTFSMGTSIELMSSSVGPSIDGPDNSGAGGDHVAV
jgi:hypothetical protein